ncbi:uncharacterized protein M421DRAFT_422761 [Didymella exigua CBS 183.55]|uniref:Uncharacterized protein n=1 Tax=Didymella exigua CBS 183.55 TaxID=1150837 RepID=A0A6A5RH21_9PLEO|nr:uncharacterized protein M421DRAFT_422761 [Didymella exigua CBS 183.55]KAF1926428.1 hypothetical protein M421DRAFT_422761 [Didymella exigua CBS 183.55]
MLILHWHPRGKNATADAYLDEIRNELDDLNNALKADAPEDWEDAEVATAISVVWTTPRRPLRT